MTSQFTTLNHPTLPTEAAARLVWAYLVEPGDEVAGTFTTIFGAAEALDLLEHAKNAPHFVTTVHSQDRDSALQHSSVTPQALRAAYERWILRLNNFQAREYFEKSSHSDFQIVTPEHQLWPPQLRDLGYAAPHALWIRGSVWATHQPAVAVVGARAAVSYTHLTLPTNREV